MPDIRSPLGAPLANAADHPLQVGVRSSGLARDQTVLHLGKVALEEAYLVLKGRVRRIDIGPLHAKVVEDLALVDRGSGLRDQLSAAHILAVPVRSLVDGHLDTLLGDRIGWVLVARAQVDVFGHWPAAVDVPLVWADFVAERPCQSSVMRSTT